MRHHVRSLMLLPALCVACSHSTPSTVPTAFTPCKVSDVGPVDSSWHQVRASGFTLCVPASWSPSRPASDSLDARAWKGKEGSVTWGLGRPPALKRTSGEITGTITGVGGTITRANPPVPMPRQTLQRCAPPATELLTVDGVSLLIDQVRCQMTWTTTAWSTAPAIYVLGEAHSAEAAKTLNAIMVTIRFASSGP
jgi:hypothetical protein